jgi:lysine 2,3-aminomutase
MTSTLMKDTSKYTHHYVGGTRKEMDDLPKQDLVEPPGTTPPDQWNDWRWQMRNRIKNIEDIKTLGMWKDDTLPNPKRLPFTVTPYYLKTAQNSQALQKTFVPSMSELMMTQDCAEDPLGEEHDSPVKCIVHRYPDRVLFLATDLCATYCRYCTRSRVIEHNGFTKSEWEKGFEYIREHEEIRDVLISGGDPLTYDDGNLEFLLSSIRAIEHVEIIRIGTKVPVVLPQRITPELVNMLKKYHPLFMSIHFTHPDELTEECKNACLMLADAGIPLGSQTVLLSGVNDNVYTMKKLFQQLLKIRIRPYYLYQCDVVQGAAHFRTPLSKGVEIIDGLRGWTSGYAVPQFVIDLPNGGGKTPVIPGYQVEKKKKEIIFRNYEGQIYSFPDIA